MADEQFPEASFAEAGYHALWQGQKAWNGVAVLSRQPAEVVCRGLPGQEEQGSRLLCARVGELLFATVYCPNGKHTGHPDFPRKLAWFDSLAEHLEARHAASEPLVLCGDFNICPQGIDSFDEEGLRGTIFHTDEERSRYRRLLDFGLADLYRQAHPDAREFSWWDYRGGAFHRGLGLRIDHLLATSPVTASLTEARIDREYRKKQDGLTASDHAPVLAELSA